MWHMPFGHNVFTKVGTSSTNSSILDLILSSMYYRVIHCDRFFATHHGKLEGRRSLVVASFGSYPNYIPQTTRVKLVENASGENLFSLNREARVRKLSYDHLAAANYAKTWQTVMRTSYSHGEYQHPTSHLRTRIILALVSYWIGRGSVDVIPKT